MCESKSANGGRGGRKAGRAAPSFPLAPRTGERGGTRGGWGARVGAVAADTARAGRSPPTMTVEKMGVTDILVSEILEKQVVPPWSPSQAAAPAASAFPHRARPTAPMR